MPPRALPLLSIITPFPLLCELQAIRSIDVTPNANIRCLSPFQLFYISFNVTVAISVFEANIRLLGGLLSAHVLASDEKRDLIPG